ncbi:ArnT family glycosyltransferase [Pseudomonas knackmussii]|uniref:ArnT family glycosyltransferase n=1 Tax=Pseudomonas knackmussii TaxID=65741 RepID=UPI003BD3EC3A
MRQRRTVLVLLLFCAALFLIALGNHQLQGSTEPRVAGIAMEMQLDHDWVTPRVNGQPFLEKPPLSLWLDVTAMHLFGPTELAVRLASALAGLGCVMLFYGMLRYLGRSTALALLAALMLATMASFWGNVRQVGEDALLCLGVSLALLSFLRAHLHQRDDSAAWPLFALGIAIASLSKGLLGLALPGVVIFVYLLVESVQQGRLHPRDWLRPLSWTFLGVLPLLFWLGALYRQQGMAGLHEILWANSVGRFNGSFVDAGHFEPWYYYLGKLPEAFLPWNLLTYLGLWHFRRRVRGDRQLLFFYVWLLAQFLLLTLASSKRMVYLMSLSPAAAVIAAEYGSLWLARWRERRYLRGAQFGVFALALLVYLGVAVKVQPREDREEGFVPLVTQIQQREAQGQSVVLYQPSERLAGAAVFYTRSRLPALDDPAALLRFLRQSPTHVAVMESLSPPAAPLKILDKQVVGKRAYYILGAESSEALQAAAGHS